MLNARVDTFTMQTYFHFAACRFAVVPFCTRVDMFVLIFWIFDVDRKCHSAFISNAPGKASATLFCFFALAAATLSSALSLCLSADTYDTHSRYIWGHMHTHSVQIVVVHAQWWWRMWFGNVCVHEHNIRCLAMCSFVIIFGFLLQYLTHDN